MDTTEPVPTADAARDRPTAVRLAVGLLWLALALYALTVGNEVLRGADIGLAAWLVPLVTVAIVAALIAFVARGSNIARLAYAVLFVLGSLPLFLDPASLFARSALIGGANLLMFALQLAAVALLFTKQGGVWFKRKAVAVAKEKAQLS